MGIPTLGTLFLWWPDENIKQDPSIALPLPAKNGMRHLPGEAQVKSQHGRQVGSRASETMRTSRAAGGTRLTWLGGSLARTTEVTVHLHWPMELGGGHLWQQGARSWAHAWALPRGQCTTQDGCLDDKTVGPGPSVTPTYNQPTSKAEPPSWPALIPDSSLSLAEPN